MDSLLLLRNAYLQRDAADLRKQVVDLREQLASLQSMMNVCDITKIFNELAPRSIYRRFFMGTYREMVLQELIARYNFTDISGRTDRTVVIRILNQIGKDASGEGLVTIYGERIKISGG